MSKLCRRWCEKGPRWRNVFQTGGAVELDEQNTAAKWWDPQADGEWLMPRCVESAGIRRVIDRTVVGSCIVFQLRGEGGISQPRGQKTL